MLRFRVFKNVNRVICNLHIFLQLATLYGENTCFPHRHRLRTVEWSSIYDECLDCTSAVRHMRTFQLKLKSIEKSIESYR